MRALLQSTNSPVKHEIVLIPTKDAIILADKDGKYIAKLQCETQFADVSKVNSESPFWIVFVNKWDMNISELDKDVATTDY